ncbi:MAG: thiolase family protein [Legionellaceae bacterium]
MNPDDVVIVAAQRTPLGSFQGCFSTVLASDLAGAAHRAVLRQAGLQGSELDEVLTGCVLQAGQGQAPARQAAFAAGIPESVPATTLNKMCGSGMKAVMMAYDAVKAGSATIVLAGGMENMTQAPYLLPKARSGYRLGHGELKDHLLLDGLEDAYEPGRLMGAFADDTATTLQMTREAQDAYAKRSMTRALQAQEQGYFNEEITPITLQTKQGELCITQDESPHPEKLNKLPRLRPAFSTKGTVTAGNSSSIADGAASLLLMTAQEASRRGIEPLARIVAYASHAQAPSEFTTAPIQAIQKVLQKAKLQPEDIDLYEINEAFAVVAMAAIEALRLNPDKVNIHGGACALGHPIGASGARILTTLIYALKQHHKKLGLAALCIGGGEATAMIIESLVDKERPC